MRLKITTVALLLASLAGPAAAQVNLRVAPYPVPYPFFDAEANKEQTIFSAGYVGTTLSQVNAADLSLNGLSLGIGYRRAIDDKMAWDAQFSIVPEFGRTDHGTKMYSVGVPLTTDFEYQAFKNQNLGIIVFAGPNFNIGSSNYASPANYGANAVVPSGEGVRTTGSTTLMYGLQFGAQAGIDAGWAKFVPFVMLSPEWGSYTSKYFSSTQNNIVSVNHSLPTMLMTSFGAQVWLGSGFGISVADQMSPSYTQDSITYNKYQNLLVNLNFSF
jgi:hypothetical protein